MTDERIIDKIRKILAYTNSPNEHEAQVAAETAQRLIIEHGISMAQVRMGSGESTTKVSVDESRIEDDVAGPWQRELLGAVTRALGGRVVFYQRGELGAVIYSVEGNAEAIVELYFYLETVLDDLGYVEAIKEQGVSKAWRASWLKGAAARIGERLTERRRALEEQEDTSMALVVIGKAIDDVIAEKHPRLSSIQRATRVDAAGYSAGKAAAEGIPLGEARVGREKAALPSGAER